MLRLALAALFIGSLSAKIPVTHEALWAMKRVGAPAPSPDGKWVVFSVIEPAYDEKDQFTDLWLVPSDGNAKPRRLTYTRGAESGAAWSPDGGRIAFSARREGDEVPQIYVLDIAAGGEAQRVTSLSTGATMPKWRPDGRALAFNSNVFPGAAGDEANRKMAAAQKARKYHARVYETFPIRYWDHWLADTKPHVFVQELEGGAAPRDLLAGTKLASSPGFGGYFGPSSEELHTEWAPDGGSVIFAATTNRNQAAFAPVDTQLFQAPVMGGEPKQLTRGRDSHTRPQFRPDGKALYCSFTPASDKVYNLDRIAMFAWPEVGERTLVAPEFDRSVESFAFTPDGKTIYLLAEDAGLMRVYSAPAGGGRARPALDTGTGVYTGLAIARNAPVIVANWESAVNPAELMRIEPAARRHTPLSDFNTARAAELDWTPVQHFTFTSRRGKTIHSLMVLPPDFDRSKKYPLLVFPHGGPHTMARDQISLRWNYHLLVKPGYVLLMPNYTGSTGFGEKFAQQIQGDPLAGPAEEINQAADEAIRRFPYIDGSRQAAAGASYGGHLMNWFQATTTRYKCLIAHAGLINLESQWGTSDTIYHREVNNGGPVWEGGKVWQEQNPIRFAKNFRTPIMLTVGERDFRVPMNQTLENWSVLQRMKVPSRLVVFENANHWVSNGEDSRFFYQQVHEWLKKWL